MQRTLIFFILVLSIGITLSFIYPYYMINPGTLTSGHATLKSDCMVCHTILQNTPDEKCIKCHAITSIGKSRVNDQPALNINSRISIIHGEITAPCISCHSEHYGKAVDKSFQHFSHSFLKVTALHSCINCHSSQKPSTEIHTRFLKDCKECHSLDSWKLAYFNHAALGDSINNCISCHAKDTPSDEMHSSLKTGVNCKQCHSFESWKPSAFNHSNYFVFDENHPSDCSKCHNVSSGYRTYTCYNCHEHSAGKIAEKHQEEGINSFENCVKCHRSGNEHETTGDGRGESHHENKRERESHEDNDED
ncbi:MAG: hypothetical protein HY965_07715 [Ignavibacteriales bacterium]|nr:hypothetical protein [Ignavibacteriales bacterium]